MWQTRFLFQNTAILEYNPVHVLVHALKRWNLAFDIMDACMPITWDSACMFCESNAANSQFHCGSSWYWMFVCTGCSGWVQKHQRCKLVLWFELACVGERSEYAIHLPSSQPLHVQTSWGLARLNWGWCFLITWRFVFTAALVLVFLEAAAGILSKILVG